MKRAHRIAAWVVGCAVSTTGGKAWAQDWPQWRGPNRDAKAGTFTAPQTWPKQLAEKWKVVIGEGDATPALVGDKVYTFSRQDGNEVVRCLEAATGKELWQDKYEALGAEGPAASHSGPRSSPAVAEGKVVTIGVRGMISCLDAATGKVVWRKDEFKAWPRFFAASSPIIVDGMCVAQLGGQNNGAIVAYDLATGEQKWKWTGESPGYASPVIMLVGDTKLVVAGTERKIVAVNLADGKLAWETPVQSRYNASTPVVDGQTLIHAAGDRGMRAVKIEKQGDKLVGTQVWTNPDKSMQFNSPVLKDGLLYGLTQQNELFCLDAKTGKPAWGTQVGMAGGGGGGRGGPGGPGAGGGRGGPGGPGGGSGGGARAGGRGPGGAGGGAGGGGMRRGGGMGGGGGYGSIVDAGTVLMVLTPSSELVVFQPGDQKFTEVAKVKVAATPTYSYPVLSGNRLLVKDRDSVVAYSVE